MILAESEVQQAVKVVKTAFPKFDNWKYSNDPDDKDYSGFTIWGEFILGIDDMTSRSFFITFDTYEESWRGHLTIGQHCYLWTSADFGDADILDTEVSATLKDAIKALKESIADLFSVFSIHD